MFTAKYTQSAQCNQSGHKRIQSHIEYRVLRNRNAKAGTPLCQQGSKQFNEIVSLNFNDWEIHVRTTYHGNVYKNKIRLEKAFDE